MIVDIVRAGERWWHGTRIGSYYPVGTALMLLRLSSPRLQRLLYGVQRKFGLESITYRD